MYTSVSNGNEKVFLIQPCSLFLKFSLLLIALQFFLVIAVGQEAPSAKPTESPTVVEGISDTTAYSIGGSLRINGTVKGAIALGGDVIVQGVVEGDVATIGGSVIQLEGSRIDGDVMVLGGTYQRSAGASGRNPNSTTVMYAGYEDELRHMMRYPSGLLKPRWSASYIGVRLVAILFWFIVSLALTAATPGTISRGIARLQLDLGRVAIIGFISAVVIGGGVPFALRYLPFVIGVLVGLMALLLILIAGLFGRVIIYAATGRWLQRKLFGVRNNSESVALLLGTTFWIVLSSLPYIWPLVVAVVLVTSLGLALTAKYRVGWARRQEAKA
ncbi:MAG TPA: polymer-forming cytoskeletal protein [Pyrinomonadaceae bacterium]|nr:polymer-forming cytoskeletal protein [Pyrinomonadaceae bacterium]